MSTRVALLWAAGLIELVSPIPGPLAVCAAYVVLCWPAWFRRLVAEVYDGESPT